MTPRTVRRPLRLPSPDDVRALVAAGWRPSPRCLWAWVDAAGEGDTLPWPRAVELARRDVARRGTA